MFSKNISHMVVPNVSGQSGTNDEHRDMNSELKHSISSLRVPCVS